MRESVWDKTKEKGAMVVLSYPAKNLERIFHTQMILEIKPWFEPFPIASDMHSEKERNTPTVSKLWDSYWRSLQRPGWPAIAARHSTLPVFSHGPTSLQRQETQLCHFSSLVKWKSDVKSLTDIMTCISFWDCFCFHFLTQKQPN